MEEVIDFYYDVGFFFSVCIQPEILFRSNKYMKVVIKLNRMVKKKKGKKWPLCF